MMKRIDPDFDESLRVLKNEIFATLNCIQIGKIESYNSSNQSAEIIIQVKARKRDGSIISYPKLVDCPVIIMQGGGAVLSFPIKKGDPCLILFNDRDIDNWFNTANITIPKTTRKHSIADGFALVGIQSKASPLTIDGEKVELISGGVDIDINGGNINLNGSSKDFVTGSELQTALNTLIISLNAKFATKFDGAGAPGTLSIDITPARTTTVKTGG